MLLRPHPRGSEILIFSCALQHGFESVFVVRPWEIEICELFSVQTRIDMNWNAKALSNVDKERIWKEFCTREQDKKAIYDTFRPCVTEKTREPDVKISPRGSRFLAKKPFGIELIREDGDKGRVVDAVINYKQVRAAEPALCSAAGSVAADSSEPTVFRLPPSPKAARHPESNIMNVPRPARSVSPPGSLPTLNSSRIQQQQRLQQQPQPQQSPRSVVPQLKLSPTKVDPLSTMRFATTSNSAIGEEVAKIMRRKDEIGNVGGGGVSPRKHIPLTQQSHVVRDIHGHSAFDFNKKQCDVTRRIQ